MKNLKNLSKNGSNSKTCIRKNKDSPLDRKEKELVIWWKKYINSLKTSPRSSVVVSCFVFIFLSFLYSAEMKTWLRIDNPTETILGGREVNEGDSPSNSDRTEDLDMLRFRIPDGVFRRVIYIEKGNKVNLAKMYRTGGEGNVSNALVHFVLYREGDEQGLSYITDFPKFGVMYNAIIWSAEWYGDIHRGGDVDMTIWRVSQEMVDFVTNKFGNSFESRNNKKYRFSNPFSIPYDNFVFWTPSSSGFFDRVLHCSVESGFGKVEVRPDVEYRNFPNGWREGLEKFRLGFNLYSYQHCADTTKINRFNIYLVNVDVYKDYTPPEIADIRLTNSNNSASISLANKRLFFTPYQTNIIRYTTYDNMQGTLWSKPRFSTLDISYYNGTKQVSLLQKSFTNWGEVSSGQFSLPDASFDYNVSLYLEDGSSDVLPASGEEQSLYVSHNFTLKYLNSYPSISISTAGVYIARDGSQYLYIKSRVNAYDLRKEVFMLVIPTTGSNTYKRCILSYNRRDENDLPLYKIESVEDITTSDWTSIDFPRYTPYNSCDSGFEKYMYGDGFLPLSEIFNVCGSSVPLVYFRAMVIDPAWWGGDWTSSSEQAKHRVRTNWINIPLNWVRPTIKINSVALSENRQKINIQYEARDDNECEIMYSVSARRYGYPDFQPLAEDRVFKRTFNTTDVNEVFSYQYPFEGEYYIQLKIKDSNVYDPTYQGLVDYTTWWYIAVDTVSPNIDLSFKQSGGVNGYFEVTGQAEVGFPLEVYASLDGSNYVFISSYTPWWSYYPYQYRTQNKVNDFYIPISSIREKLGYLSSCPLKLKIVSSDGLNPQSAFEKEVFYDADRPLFEKVYSPPKSTNDNNLVYLSGSVMDNRELTKVTYEIYKFTEDNMYLIDDHKLEISGSSCSYTAPVLLLPYEDQYLVRISIEDKAGNVNTYSYYVSYDTTPPSSVVVKRTEVFAGKVQMQFECEVSANIKIYDDTGECLFDATSQGFNYFEKLMKLGKHNLAIVLRDLAGNVTTSYHLVEVKQAIPINTQLPTLYGNELTCIVSAEPSCTLQLVDSFGIVLATAPVDYYGRALFQNVRLPRGENTLKYVSIDLAGNRVESEPFKVTVVQMRPLPPELVQIEPMTLNGTELVITQNDFVIKGKTYPNVPVIILLNGEVFQVVTSTTDGTFEYKVDKVIENGEYYLQVKVYKDGLESNPSPPIKFVLASLDPSLQQLEIVLWQKNAYEGSTILIRVYDKTKGQPVSGARVVVQDEEYVTDAEGFAGKRGSPIHRGVKIKPNYNRQVAFALRRTIGFASTTDDSFDTEKEITIYAVIEEGTYKKYGTKKVVLLKQDKKNLFLSPNNDGINDIVAVKNLHNSVKIFDLRGRLVRTLYNDNGTIYWDGRDENGQPLPSGVYLYLTSDGQKGKIYVGR